MDIPKEKKETGAVLVEIAIAMPIFLIFVFMFIWISITQNQLSTLSTAVQFGTRLAVTRGKADNMGYNHLNIGEGLIPEIEEMVYSNRVLDLIASEDLRSTAETTYNQWSTETFGLNFAELPAYYRYAIVYISQSMKQGIGNSVRFPCDPDDPSNSDPEEGKGCLQCRFINPGFMDGTGPTSLTDESIYEPYPEAPPTDQLGLICEFKPPGNLYQSIANLINMVTGESDWNSNKMIRMAFFIAPE